MKNRIFILDETNGGSLHGKALKELAERQNIDYFTNSSQLNSTLGLKKPKFKRLDWRFFYFLYSNRKTILKLLPFFLIPLSILIFIINSDALIFSVILFMAGLFLLGVRFDGS